MLIFQRCWVITFWQNLCLVKFCDKQAPPTGSGRCTAWFDLHLSCGVSSQQPKRHSWSNFLLLGRSPSYPLFWWEAVTYMINTTLKAPSHQHPHSVIAYFKKWQFLILPPGTFYLFYHSCMELMLFIQPFPVYSVQNWTWFEKNNAKASTQLWTPHFCCCYGFLHLLIHGIVPFACPCRNVERSGALHLPWPLMRRWRRLPLYRLPPLNPLPPSPHSVALQPILHEVLVELLLCHADLASFVMPLPGSDLPFWFSRRCWGCTTEQGRDLPGWILTTAMSVEEVYIKMPKFTLSDIIFQTFRRK